MREPLTGTYQGARQRVRFGPGSRATLTDELRSLGAQRVMLVTGRTVASSGLPDKVLEHAGDAEIMVWDGSREHCPYSAVARGIEAARDHGAQALISLGGSSPVEVARAIALGTADPAFRSHPRPLADPADTPMLPVAAITTTLSQAEFTNFVGVTDDDTGEKHMYADLGVLPRVVILDAELTIDTPAALWSSTGVKALDSAIGGHVQQTDQLFRDPVTREAVRELVHLLESVASGRDDIASRQRLQVVAWMAMFTRFQLPTTRPNPPSLPWFGSASRHQLGGATRAPHGALSGVLLPAAIEFHIADAPDRLEELAATLDTDPRGLADRIRAMVADLGLPTRLGQFGISDEQVAAVVDAMLREQPALGDRREDVVAALAAVT